MQFGLDFLFKRNVLAVTTLIDRLNKETMPKVLKNLKIIDVFLSPRKASFKESILKSLQAQGQYIEHCKQGTVRGKLKPAVKRNHKENLWVKSLVSMNFLDVMIPS